MDMIGKTLLMDADLKVVGGKLVDRDRSHGRVNPDFVVMASQFDPTTVVRVDHGNPWAQGVNGRGNVVSEIIVTQLGIIVGITMDRMPMMMSASS